MPDNLITSDVATVSGYLARPMDDANHPGIVVLQEWWGLDEHIKDIARRFAREGFVALAPDLFHGKVTGDADEARKLSGGMDRTRAVRDVQAAVDWVRDQEYSDGKVGTIGYCMGGGMSLLTACNHDVNAAIVYYGGIPNPIELLDNLTAPVLAIYGDDEVERVEQIEKGLKDRGKSVESHVYEGARHAFFNDTWEERYHAEAAADAWTKTLAFLRSHLA